ncbi:MAG: glutamate synthase subunit beta [Planctomycetes bacterium]|nr:glutamate synthase subunit beta [Planctomycetota bacterium]
MGKIRGFLEYKRKAVGHRPVAERVLDFAEMDIALTPDDLIEQTARCMDCGIPFCHGVGCPLKNLIPEFNELVYRGQWRQACENLHSTNNFPEITGRVCPAPCETACTLGVNDEPVMIRQIEYQIVERGFSEGWIKPLVSKKSGKRVAVVGSGPAGLAAAQQLSRAGYGVVVFEKGAEPGGLLRYGIPDFKLAKSVIDRRLDQMRAEGVEFQSGVEVGEDVSARYLRKMFDCICLTMGAGEPRDLNIVGRGYENVHFAMDFLTQQNRLNCGEQIERTELINAKDKAVVVIGGGDTGSDCVGTARRQGAREIHQLEILPEPPESRPPDTPWPEWPRIMRTSTSHEEGCRRRWSTMTKRFVGRDISVTGLDCVKVEWFEKNGQWKLKEIPGTEFSLEADLVLIAMGFVHVEHSKLIKDLGLKLDGRGNVAVDNYQTTAPDVFAAGDTISGASLVVRAIESGRCAAAAVDKWLRKV